MFQMPMTLNPKTLNVSNADDPQPQTLNVPNADEVMKDIITSCPAKP